MKKKLSVVLMATFAICLGGCSFNKKKSSSASSYLSESSQTSETVTSTSSSQTSSRDEIYDIYLLYLESGGTMTYEEWLETIKGTDGASLLTGSGAPSASLGKDGDSYIDLTSWNFYVKENGTWVLKGNIKGADGHDGHDGQDGSGGATTENPQELAFFPLDDGTYAVTQGYSYYLSEVNIPATYKGKPVSRMMGFGGDALKAISIPASIVCIDSYALFYAEALTQISYSGTLNQFKNITFGEDWCDVNRDLSFKFTDKTVTTANLLDTFVLYVTDPSHFHAKSTSVVDDLVTICNKSYCYRDFYAIASSESLGLSKTVPSKDLSVTVSNPDAILYATYEQYDELYRFCLVCSSPDPSSTKVTIKYGSIVKQFTVKVEDPISTTVSEVAKITSNLPFTTNDNFYLTEQWYTMTGYVKEYYELNGQCSFYFYDTDINETIWVFYPLCEQAISTGMNVRVSGQLYRYEYDTTTIYYGLCEGRAEAITPEVDYDYSLVVTGVPSSYTLLVWEWNNGFEGNWLDMIKMDDNAYCVNLTKDNYLIAVFDSSYTAATASWDYCLSQTSDYVRNVTQAVFQFSILFPALS